MAVDNFWNTAQGIISNDNINGILKLNELGGAFQNAYKASKTSWGSMGGNILASAGSLIGKNDDFSESQKARQAGLRNIAGMFGLWGKGLALLDGAAAGLVDATDSGLTNINPNTAKTLGINTGWTNAFNSSGITSGIGAVVGQRVNQFGIDDVVKSGESGYADTMNYLRALTDVSNAKVMPWDVKNLNNKIDSGEVMARKIYDTMTTSTMRKNSDYDQNLQHQWQNRIAGQNYLGITIGKQGMKLMSASEARALLLTKKEDLIKLQNGGEIPGIDTNLLPEGALHARKNNLSELNPDLEDATKKGIPVMSAEEGGETPVVGEQVAEIENNEIIFRLEVTKKLEELRKDGSEEAMIEAGRLVAEELIENTQDNTGQITEEVENG